MSHYTSTIFTDGFLPETLKLCVPRLGFACSGMIFEKRAQPLDAEARTRQLEVSARYRHKNRESIREADRQRREQAAAVKAEKSKAKKSHVVKPQIRIYGVYGAQARQIVGDPRPTAPLCPATSDGERRQQGPELDGTTSGTPIRTGGIYPGGIYAGRVAAGRGAGADAGPSTPPRARTVLARTPPPIKRKPLNVDETQTVGKTTTS
ncbi:hypothetical protein B0H16DRAFT_1744927 [Mycena metata]|uniref:Uncharacterized protein n=1 Tax=Mycena metata TaxID=1033252 RepID=A0AAD7MD95_9AGAR|nr:hypothetical protein B0H16DRAFT_1744927 [Mycena metata]